MPLIVDLACGPGGFSDGWELAGGSHQDVIGFDWAYCPRASYRHGINGYRRAYTVDLFKPEEAAERILRALGGRRPDWVIGSSSCKPFQVAGAMQKKRRARGADDERDTLLQWCQVAGALDPVHGISMENVPKATKHPGWPEALNAIDIPLVAEWTLRACDYGLQTSRERRFWIWRRDWSIPSLPVVNRQTPICPSVLKCNGKRNPTGEVCYLIGYGSGAKGWERETIFTNAEALLAQGAIGKRISGGRHASAQQIADMIPPPLAAAVLKSALGGLEILPGENAIAESSPASRKGKRSA